MFVISMILLTAVTILLMHVTCGPLKLLKFKVMYKHDKAKKTKNVECFSQYKILRKKFVYESRKAKQDYFSGEICNNANPKKMWKAIGTLPDTRKMATSHGISAEKFNIFLLILDLI